MKLSIPLALRTHLRTVPILDCQEPDFDDKLTSNVRLSETYLNPPAWVEADVPDWQWQEFMAARHEAEQDNWK
jgi:hypothetical protein